MKNHYIFAVIALFLITILSSFAQDGPVNPAITGTMTYWGLTPPLRDLPVITKAEFRKMEADAAYERNIELANRSYPFSESALPKGPDPVWQRGMGVTKVDRAPIMNFDGAISPYYPPDANGTAGPLYYMQTINCVYTIYDKATGSIEAGPTNMNQLFAGVTGSDCNDGDPLVLFDDQANRWLAIEFSLCGSTDRMLIAVSQTSDPTGSWHKYSFDVDDMPDYEKFGIWQDGYYMATNNGSGKDIYVFERSQMLSGGVARFVGFNNPWRPNSMDGIMCVPPIDNDGPYAPIGKPALFIAANDDAVSGGSDQLWIYELDVNWTTLSNSTFDRVQQINVPAFDSNFGNSWDNIPQPATGNKLDAIPMLIMNRPQYRNFGTYETIMCCYTVDLDATDHAGIRWYELRRTSGEWSIRQTGTYGPDQHNRWMGSISMNGNGEIALGYSISSNSVYPGIRYCGQSASENANASGIMDIQESVIQTGSYSQTGYNRWGDYSGMSVDPDDDHTFWFTTEYIGTGDSRLTKIASFQFSLEAPMNLIAQLAEETGAVTLHWTHHGGAGFDHYNIYRGITLIGTSESTFYTDNLPDYGIYRYSVSAVFTGGESEAAITDVQWGNAQAEVTPPAVEAFVVPDGNTSSTMGLNNVGELPLEFTSSLGIPPGAGMEVLAYCNGLGGCGESISNVAYGDVSNSSTCNGYEDFSSLSYLVPKGGSIDITIQNGSNAYPEDVCGIWIDWNQNENFLDDVPVTVNGNPGTGPYTATITVPDDAKNGMTRMRIRVKRGGTLSPCGLVSNGEVEDYSINVLGWVTASPMEGAIQAGETQPITFSFDASGMVIGDYNATYTISSNDPDNAEIIVPVTMHVTNIAAVVTADKDSLCLGGSTSLHASVIGGSGSYTYLWTSDPVGFTSTESDPMVNPLVTTIYYVEITDGEIIVENNITIAVVSLPVINLGQDFSACAGNQSVLDAGPGFASYLWNTGETSQSITITDAGTYWVEVANNFGCSKRDSVVFTINPLPEVSLGSDQNMCEGSLFVLSAGTGFASYLWNTGATADHISVNLPGEFWVQVTDETGCSNQDTIILTLVPAPTVSLGADQAFCEGTSVPLSAGAEFTSYLWSTGETSSSINAGQPGLYWVEVTDANSCSARDTVVLTMDPLPIAANITSGPTSVDNFSVPTSDYTSSAGTFATSYEWMLEPAEAGTISGTTTSAQVTWSAGFTGTANVSVRGKNDCGSGTYSPLYTVNVYSSQGIGEKNLITAIKLFPNPNDGEFTLQFNSAKEQEISFHISTSGGNRILENKQSIPAGPYQKTLNLKSYPAGTYYLVISNSKGRMINRQQIVVQ
jgi:hypothetical protein